MWVGHLDVITNGKFADSYFRLLDVKFTDEFHDCERLEWKGISKLIANLCAVGGVWLKDTVFTRVISALFFLVWPLKNRGA
jgi:hypothetical protein